MRITLLLLLALLGLARQPAASQPAAGPAGQVLSISDIHFGVSDMTLWRVPVTQWQDTLQRLPADSQPIDPTGNKQDTNYWLLNSFLAATKARCPNPAFIVITGDLLAHNLTRTPADCDRFALMRSIYQFLGLQISRQFPTAVVLPGLGNNDTDMQDDHPPTPRFREMFAQAWAPLIYSNLASQQHFIREFTTRGYYSYALPGVAGRKLIMLNSVLFLNYIKGEPAADKVARLRQARAELHWLHQQLATAAPADRLWLAMHVPPGIDAYSSTPQNSAASTSNASCATLLWDPDLTTLYTDTVRAYAHLVKAGLAGHTHMDEFRLLSDKQGKAVSFLHVTPAVTPLFGNNPGFQVLDYDPASLGLRDATTYYLNLYQNPQLPPQVQAWNPEYAFNATYHTSGLDTLNLRQVWRAIAPFNSALQQKYASFYAASAPPSSPSPTDFLGWPYYWCAAGKTTATEFCQCVAYYKSHYQAAKSRAAARPAPSSRGQRQP